MANKKVIISGGGAGGSVVVARIDGGHSKESGRSPCNRSRPGGDGTGRRGSPSRTLGGAGGEEYFQDLHVAATGSHEQRGFAVFSHRVHVGALGQECLDVGGHAVGTRIQQDAGRHGRRCGQRNK